MHVFNHWIISEIQVVCMNNEDVYINDFYTENTTVSFIVIYI